MVSQERLANNHPLISVCTLRPGSFSKTRPRFQSKQVQHACEVRSVPVNNPYRAVVFFVKTRRV